MEGAGGVGGLLCTTLNYQPSTINCFPSYDGNGNISAWIDATGTLLARMDYSPFGQLVAQYKFTSAGNTTLARLPFGFSTKYTDSESGLLYYGYRFYDPVTGRWPSRDPIAEEGGVNLYGYVGNDAGNNIDYLGLIPNADAERKRKIAEEQAERAKPPTIAAYAGPKELNVDFTPKALNEARDYFGYYMAVEALRMSLLPWSPQNVGNLVEYGGQICAKCIEKDGKKNYNVIYTGLGTIGASSHYNVLLHFSIVGGVKIYSEVCPEGYDAIGAYHSHPIDSGGTSPNASKADWTRFRIDSDRESNLRDNFAGTPGDNITSGDQIAGKNSPEYVSGVFTNKKVGVSKLPSPGLLTPPKQP